MNLQDFLGDTVYYLLIGILCGMNLYLMALIWEIRAVTTMTVG